jgi:hypothetical protein
MFVNSTLCIYTNVSLPLPSQIKFDYLSVNTLEKEKKIKLYPAKRIPMTEYCMVLFFTSEWSREFWRRVYQFVQKVSRERRMIERELVKGDIS